MLNTTYIQWRAAVSFLALFLFTSLATAAPQITEFEVDQVTTLRPGTALDFTLSGTPKARATIRISGIPRLIVLKETGSGFYEGRYIVRQKDRLSSRSAVVATLSKGKSHTIARLGQSILASADPVPSEPPAPAPTAIAITKFSVDSYENLEPGAELDFTLVGTQAGRAFFTIENVIANRRMREVRPGVYTGQYTIRRQDKLPAALNVVGTLQAEGQTVRAQLDKQIVNNSGSNNAPSSANPFSHFSPRDNESIPYSNNFTVSGDFEDDTRKGGVDPKSIQLLFDGRDVTSQSTISAHGFSYRPTNLTPGRHSVEVRGRDNNGNIVRSNWDFRMLDAAPAAAFPLDITSPRDGAEVGSGAIEVRGRTLPNASVQVGVTAGILGLSQRIFENTLVADRQGYFSFSFQPQVRVPGARYDVTVRATRDNEMRERKMTLIQQR